MLTVAEGNQFLVVQKQAVSAMDWRPGLSKEDAGEHLQRDVTVQGVSGHQLEFPFVIDLPDSGRHFIQPVASGDEHIDWSNVYKAGGKMLNLKSAGADEHQRIVVIEDIPGDQELGKAMTLLSVTTSVLLFSHRAQWLDHFRRAA
jgi:hypothetical protein